MLFLILLTLTTMLGIKFHPYETYNNENKDIYKYINIPKIENIIPKNINIFINQIEDEKDNEQGQAIEEEIVENTTSKLNNAEYENNLNLLAHLIYAEAGSDHISDEHQILVGTVAMNRVKSKKYPDTLYEVIYQSGQYACTWDGNFEKEPNERAYSNAKIVLDHEIENYPENIIYSAEFEQGSGVYKVIGNTFFCYE